MGVKPMQIDKTANKGKIETDRNQQNYC